MAFSITPSPPLQIPQSVASVPSHGGSAGISGFGRMNQAYQKF